MSVTTSRVRNDLSAALGSPLTISCWKMQV